MFWSRCLHMPTTFVTVHRPALDSVNNWRVGGDWLPLISCDTMSQNRKQICYLVHFLGLERNIRDCLFFFWVTNKPLLKEKMPRNSNKSPLRTSIAPAEDPKVKEHGTLIYKRRKRINSLIPKLVARVYSVRYVEVTRMKNTVSLEI
jgi:hypothetical protein